MALLLNTYFLFRHGAQDSGTLFLFRTTRYCPPEELFSLLDGGVGVISKTQVAYQIPIFVSPSVIAKVLYVPRDSQMKLRLKSRMTIILEEILRRLNYRPICVWVISASS